MYRRLGYSLKIDNYLAVIYNSIKIKIYGVLNISRDKE